MTDRESDDTLWRLAEETARTFFSRLDDLTVSTPEAALATLAAVATQRLSDVNNWVPGTSGQSFSVPEVE